jgi:hypothetical protein
MLTRVFPPVPSVTRRRLLLGATAIPLALTASGCTQDEPVEPPVDPDRAALQSALETEAALSSVITSWTPATPDDQRAALQVVDAHVEALTVALGTGTGTGTGTAGTPSAAPTVSTREMQRSVDAAADAHTRALRTSGPRVSPLIAAIAASDAALGASLRGQRP